MYGCEKAECQRIDAFERWCCRRLLRVPWTARRLNQSILKEISPEYSLEGLMLKLKLQYRRSWSSPDMKNWLIWKNPNAGKDWRQEEKGLTEDEMIGWHHRLIGHGFGWTPGDGDGHGSLACCSLWGCKTSDTTRDWTELNWVCLQSHWPKAFNKRAYGIKGRSSLLPHCIPVMFYLPISLSFRELWDRIFTHTHTHTHTHLCCVLPWWLGW